MYKQAASPIQSTTLNSMLEQNAIGNCADEKNDVHDFSLAYDVSVKSLVWSLNPCGLPVN
jgi:hypothetical protein